MIHVAGSVEGVSYDLRLNEALLDDKNLLQKVLSQELFDLMKRFAHQLESMKRA